MSARLAQTLRKVTFRDSVYFVEAGVFLLVAALLKTFVPLRWYAPLLGERRAGGAAEPVEVDLGRLLPVVRAVNRVVRFSPFKGKCLVQALCGFLMLRAKRLPSDFYLGVSKNASRDVIAHAWVKSGDHFVTGRRGHRHYTVISVFSKRPISGMP